ncbi:MAG: recombinase family protein [Patescibacteria group bacterium]
MQTQLNNLNFTIAPTKRVAIYLRVSTEEQAKEGHYGLEVQEDRLKQFCSSQGFTLLDEHVFRDEGLSGTLEIESRPGLAKAFKAAENKEFDLLLVYKLDRIFRNQRKLLNALAKLVEYGVAFQSSTEAFDTATPSGRLMLQILGSFAEHEREVIRDRMMGGKRRAAAEGKWVTGVPPYGYRVNTETKKLIVCPEEAEVVVRFFEWLVHERCSLREITKRAIELKLPTPKHTTITARKKKGSWYKRTINRILANEVYTGETYFGKYKTNQRTAQIVTDTSFHKDSSEHVLITVPAIISKEMFAQAIEQLHMNRRMQKRNEKRIYLFSGLLYSGSTGKKLQSGYQKPKKDQKTPTLGKYYHVYVQDIDRVASSDSKHNPEGQCAETRLIPIWTTLVEILSNPDNVLPRLEEYTFKNRNEARIEKKVAELTEQVKNLKDQQGRIALAFAEMNLAEDDYRKLIRDNKERVNTLTIERDKLTQSLLKADELVNRNDIIKMLFKQYESRLANVSYEEQQYILRLFIERISLFIQDNYAEVVFRFPSSIKSPTSKQLNVDQKMRLVLHVKILSETQRRQYLLKSNPLMYKPRMSSII